LIVGRRCNSESEIVVLVPQVSTTTGYLSGGGVNLRQNSIQIDGAQSGDLFGIGTTGQPGAQANGKSIPLDAVKEYQVLLSPFDVRQGNFGGLLINAVTKSGTNEWTGTIYGDTRNQNTTRTQTYLNDRSQQHYAGSLGGPIVHDKLFFFVSGEVQRLRTPTSGSYIGDPAAYVSQASIDQVNGILSSKYNFSGGGTGEQIINQNPNTNVFARLDANLPFATRLVLRHNFASADNTSFSRSFGTSASPNFNLTSNLYQFSNTTHSSVAEFLTNLSSGVYNELLLNYGTISDFRTVPVQFPQLTVRGIVRSDKPAQTANFVLGTETSSQGNALDQRTVEVTDNLTIPVGSHSLTFGTKNIFYKSINLFASNSLGNWTFADPTALQNGTPSSYLGSAPAPTDPYNGLATIRANTYGVYAQDQWTASPTLTVSLGVRYDKPDFRNLPPENDEVFTDYGRHTSSVPTQGQFSPRLGFNWDITGDQRNQLRGGIGSFTGNVPFVYLSNAFGNSGLSGFSSINCNNTTGNTNLAPPIFTAATAASPPVACDLMTAGVRTVGGGATISGPASGANVATIDPNFKYPKYLKASLGYDHRLPWDMIGTIEGLYSRSQNNAFYQNLALAGPQGVDNHGRVLYGSVTATGGTAKVIGPRQQVIDVTNASGDYTWSTTAQLQKAFSNSFEGSLAYTYQQARDVVSVTSSTQGSNFRYQRDVSGDLQDRTVTRSKYDQPHRIVGTGTYRFPSLTDVSVIYQGGSGSPYDYVYGQGIGTGSGDANADGQSQNDLMYVPLNVNDPNEILFTGAAGIPGSTAASQANAAAQAAAFDNFINSTPCLAAARGQILQRNACRNPWTNQFDISAAQSLGNIAGPRLQNLQVRLDIINFGNLLNKNWGKQAFSSQGSTCGQICSATVALVQSGNRLATGTAPTTGIYTFNPTYAAYNSDNVSSNYQMMLSLRYSF
jgi:hypothetical protein